MPRHFNSAAGERILAGESGEGATMIEVRGAWLVLLILPITSVSAARGEATEVYRRATVLEDRVGRTEVRSAYGVRLTVFGECGNRDCPEERVYDEVIRIDFALGSREAVGNEIVRSEEPAGTVLLAISFSAEDLETFRDELGSRLRRLSAQAFVEPFAGWRGGKPPFDSSLAARSELPSWVCFESGAGGSVTARFHRDIREGPDGRTSVSTGSQTSREPPTPVCDEMAAATEGLYPQVVETLPVPRRLLEVALRFEGVERIDGDDPASLSVRPEGVRVVKREIPEGVHGHAASGGGRDSLSFATHGSDGWKFDAYAEPAALPIGMLENAWLQRWTLETLERRLGPGPTERSVARRELVVAYLATLPAIPAEEITVAANVAFSSAPPPVQEIAVVAETPARIDRTAFLDAIANRLDLHHGPPDERIEDLVSRPEAGLESDGWIVVLCNEDGSAVYHLPPTTARQRVINADLFCGAVESLLR